MTQANGNSKTAILAAEGPKMLFIKKSEIPEGTKRGRVSFLNQLPFWNELTSILHHGLSPAEAIEIDLAPVKTPEGKEIPPKTLLSAIRHQFVKSGLSKQYSLILREANRLFITDNDTAAMA
jgi:hypothetical protein